MQKRKNEGDRDGQNQNLLNALLNTGTTGLIEATFDRFWGCGTPINSIRLMEGKWNGNNELGQILMDCRREFRRARGLDTQVPGINPPQSNQSNQMVGVEQTPAPEQNPIRNQLAPTNQSSQQVQMNSMCTDYQQSAYAAPYRPPQLNQNQQQPLVIPFGNNNTNLIRVVGPGARTHSTATFSNFPNFGNNGTNGNGNFNRMQTPMQMTQWQPPPTYVPAFSNHSMYASQAQGPSQNQWQYPSLPQTTQHSSPESTASGFEQGARRVSYDPSQSPVFVS